MVQRHLISHLKALIMETNIPGRQGHGSIKGLPHPLFLKSTIYHKEWAWQANKNALSPIFRIKKAHYQTFQMRYCLYLYYSWFSLKLVKSKISVWRVWYIASACICMPILIKKQLLLNWPCNNSMFKKGKANLQTRLTWLFCSIQNHYRESNTRIAFL